MANKTMDEHIAALLWAIAEEKKSFVSAAGPQWAGKSTVLWAMLDHVPGGTPVHELSGEMDEMNELARKAGGGYLEVGEISDQKPSRYIWGEPVRALFNALDAGFSLATTMHASGAEDVFQQICAENKISDAAASVIQYVVHIKRFGEDKPTYWRRIDTVYEIRNVENGVPVTSELFSWQEGDDSFVALNPPSLLAASSAALADRAGMIGRQAAEIREAIEL